YVLLVVARGGANAPGMVPSESTPAPRARSIEAGPPRARAQGDATETDEGTPTRGRAAASTPPCPVPLDASSEPGPADGPRRHLASAPGCRHAGGGMVTMQKTLGSHAETTL